MDDDDFIPLEKIPEYIMELREQNRVLRSNLVNCAARLEAYYGEDYPAVRDAQAALTATSQPGGEG